MQRAAAEPPGRIGALIIQRALVLGTTGVVLAVAVIAACAPMYQATRVDPMQSLRV